MKKYGCIVTDCEDAFRNAIKKYLPDVPLFRCWNHLWGSIERFVRGKSGNATDVTFYTDSIRSILCQPTKELSEKLIEKSKKGYTSKSNNYIAAWTVSFTNYFEKEIYPELDSLASYEIKKCVPSLFNDFTGLTTNHGEGLNNLLKEIAERKELPLDVLVLICFHLSIFYCNEIKIAFANKGNYRLKGYF